MKENKEREKFQFLEFSNVIYHYVIIYILEIIYIVQLSIKHNIKYENVSMCACN